MELRRDLLATVGTLAAMNILMALGAIWLLARMSPAIERILEENVFSMQATEEMLDVLIAASAGGAEVDPVSQARFEAALERARNNVTEPEEPPLLDEIQTGWNALRDGDETALEPLSDDVLQLAAVNQQAMVRADLQARRLGSAGAWAAAFIAAFYFLASLLVLRQMRRRVLVPLLEIHRVLDSARSGDTHRRCTVGEASTEIEGVATAVNQMLDARAEHPSEQPPPTRDRVSRIEHATLLQLLDERTIPTVLVDEAGDILAGNQAALERLAGPDGEALRIALRETESAANGLSRTPVDGDTPAWLCDLPAAP